MSQISESNPKKRSIDDVTETVETLDGNSGEKLDAPSRVSNSANAKQGDGDIKASRALDSDAQQEGREKKKSKIDPSSDKTEAKQVEKKKLSSSPLPPPPPAAAAAAAKGDEAKGLVSDAVQNNTNKKNKEAEANQTINKGGIDESNGSKNLTTAVCPQKETASSAEEDLELIKKDGGGGNSTVPRSTSDPNPTSGHKEQEDVSKKENVNSKETTLPVPLPSPPQHASINPTTVPVQVTIIKKEVVGASLSITTGGMPLQPPVAAAVDTEGSMTGMSQSERKRYREKKRRSEITCAIDHLTKILIKVEPTNLFQQNNLVYTTSTNDFPPRSLRTSNNSSGQQPLNRTEIINHAAQVLDRLFKENEERKMHLMRLHSGVPKDTNTGNGGGNNAATATGNQHQMMMFHQPTIYHQPSAPAPQSKIAPTPGQAVGFANGTIPMHPIMQMHPSFIAHQAGFQVPASGSTVDKNGKNSKQGANVIMQATNMTVPNANSHQHRAYAAEQQWYIAQQFLGQQKRMQEGGQ